LTNSLIPNFLNICAVGDELLHAERERQTDERTERQTEITNLSAAFRNFVKAPTILNRFLFFRKGTTQKI